MSSRMFFNAIQATLDCSDNDEEALFALSLIYATIKNKGGYMLYTCRGHCFHESTCDQRVVTRESNSTRHFYWILDNFKNSLTVVPLVLVIILISY